MAPPSRPNHLPEVPSPNTNPLGIWFQHLNLWGTQTFSLQHLLIRHSLIISSVFSYTTQEKQKIKLKTLYPTLNICLYLFYFVMFIQKKCWWQCNNLGLWLMFMFSTIKRNDVIQSTQNHRKQNGDGQGLGEGGMWSYYLMAIEFQFCKMKRIPEMDGCNGCTKL